MTNETVKFYYWCKTEDYDRKNYICAPSILYSNLHELFENLPDLDVFDNITIYEATDVTFSEMKKSKAGFIVKSNEHYIGEDISLSELTNPLPPQVPPRLIGEHINAIKYSGQNDILLTYATCQDYHEDFRAAAIRILPFQAFDADTLITLLSDEKNIIREMLATKHSATELFPDWVYKILKNDRCQGIADEAKYSTLIAALYAHALKLNEDKKCTAISFLKEFRAVIFYIMPHFNNDEIFTDLDLSDAMDVYYKYRSAQPVLNILRSKPRKYFLSHEDAITNIHN